jgi:hypothetical protein
MLKGATGRRMLRVFRPPIGRRKDNLPETRSGGLKFQGGVKPFGGLARRANDLASDSLFGRGVFQNHACSGGKVLFHGNERAVRIDVQRDHIMRCGLSLQSDVDLHSYAKQDALAAAPIFSAGKLLGGGRFVSRQTGDCRTCAGRGAKARRFGRHSLRGVHNFRNRLPRNPSSTR